MTVEYPFKFIVQVVVQADWNWPKREHVLALQPDNLNLLLDLLADFIFKLHFFSLFLRELVVAQAVEMHLARRVV